MKSKILVIVGPTASGKSAFAVLFAKRLNGEIVSADSRQVYKGLNIGSGKITKREMMGIPHYMLDLVSPAQKFTVVQFREMAEKVIDEILARGKLPILVGGTGLYVDAITKGLIIPDVPPNQTLRQKLNKLTSTKLYKQLLKLDPKRAKQIDKNNPRRLVRAIEIAKAIGKSPPPHNLSGRIRYVVTTIGLNPGRDLLKQKIKERLRARVKKGMISEVCKLHGAGVGWKRMFDLGLEYRYVSLYLQHKLTKSGMLEKLETAINQYAKRQMTWFGRDKSITWLTGKQVNRPNPSLFRKIRSLLHAGAPSNP